VIASVNVYVRGENEAAGTVTDFERVPPEHGTVAGSPEIEGDDEIVHPVAPVTLPVSVTFPPVDDRAFGDALNDVMGDTTSIKVLGVALEAASCTVIVTLYVPMAEVVPLMVPVLVFRLSPEGSSPEGTDQE